MIVLNLINDKIREFGGLNNPTVKAFDEPLYEKGGALIYIKGEPMQFQIDDNYELSVGHLLRGGRPVGDFGDIRHDLTLIGIGSQRYVSDIIKIIQEFGILDSYDLNPSWGRWFSGEQYNENLLFTIRYFIDGDLNILENYCKRCD